MATGDLIEWESPLGLRGTTTRRGIALDGGNLEALTFGTSVGRANGNVSKVPENLTVRTVAKAGTREAVQFTDNVRSNAPRSAQAALAKNPTTSKWSTFNTSPAARAARSKAYADQIAQNPNASQDAVDSARRQARTDARRAREAGATAPAAATADTPSGRTAAPATASGTGNS